MTDINDACALATAAMKRPHDDPGSPWDLVEFPEGWLVREASKGIGAATLVIERASGRVLQFPSAVPPGRIMRDFPKVAGKARVVADPAS
jgi:hypothetical protein